MDRLVAVVALAAAAVACESASITGKVVIPPGHDGLAIVALIGQWREVPDPRNPAGQPREEPVLVGQLGLGTAGPNGGEYPYTFHSLDTGRYWVGAYIDAGDDRDFMCDPQTFDFETRLEVDASDEAKATASHDLYVGMNGPGTGSITGTVHMSDAVARGSVEVVAFRKPIGEAKTEDVLDYATFGAGACAATGSDVKYSFFNLPPGNVYLYAIADPELDDGQEGVAPRDAQADDVFAFHVPNPLNIPAKDPGAIENADLWLERSSPDLGSISGKVKFSAPLADGGVELDLFSADPFEDPTAELIGIDYLRAVNATELAFHFPAVPLGRVFLVAFPWTRDGTRELSTWRAYTAGGRDIAPIELTREAPAAKDLEFRLGVGRVTGRIELAGMPAELKLVHVAAGEWVAGGGLGAPQLEVRATEAVPVAVTNGLATGTYTLFGLEDGRFGMGAFPDSGTGSVNDALRGEPYPGSPTDVVITNGGSATCDFSNVQ